MKTLLLFLLTLTPLVAQCEPNQDPGCLNNCWMQSPDCTSCHITQGEPKTICPTCCMDCWGCSPIPQLSAMPLQQSKQQRARHETLIGYIRELAGLPQDKMAFAGYGIDPRVHLKLMQAAALKTDAADMGRCRKAFRPATVQLLPGEIARLRENLRVGSGVLATFPEPVIVPFKRSTLARVR